MSLKTKILGVLLHFALNLKIWFQNQSKVSKAWLAFYPSRSQDCSHWGGANQHSRICTRPIAAYPGSYRKGTIDLRQANRRDISKSRKSGIGRVSGPLEVNVLFRGFPGFRIRLLISVFWKFYCHFIQQNSWLEYFVCLFKTNVGL